MNSRAQHAQSRANAVPVRAPGAVGHASARPHMTMGNQATQAMLLGGRIQAKLGVSAPDDPMEREADDVAARVMRAGPVQRKAGSSAMPSANGALATQVDGLRGGGAPLAQSTRNFFEPRFGQDFSAVRIHANARAAESARSINALAYTHGSDIVFARGQYQPESFAGRKLLAHELAHVVQQSQTVQRRCGPDQITNADGCEFPTSDPAVGPEPEPDGELLRFNVNCSDFVSADEWRKARTFADSMLATDRVRVHGFASMDGDYTFNVNLSCARAKMAAHALSGGGIPHSQIEILAHGPTPGPVDDRRSAILERYPRIERPPTPQLTGSVLTAPEPGFCGDVFYELMWDISRPSHAVNGGFVVQEVTITFSEEDCSDEPLPWEFVSPLHYYEAWRVNPGEHHFDTTDDDTDQFYLRRTDTIPSTGSVHWTAVATYYDDVADLPSHMVRHNLDTVAGPLRSSLMDPMLAGIPSRGVRHTLSITWDCCPDQSRPTEIGPYTPR
jgi:outer membrane protein OmpA-like peptidoglycan-associated protein